MKCSIFIATSVDGYIATEDGGVEWLETAGKPGADLGDQTNMAFSDYMFGVDCMIMGRKTMDKLSSFNLTSEQWPYGDRRIIVLSNTVREPPDNLREKVEIYSGELSALMTELESAAFKHAYIDGGTTITSFFNLGLINEMCLTRAPVLLGAGKPLFGKINKQIKLENAQVKAYSNDFIQVLYTVNYL